MGGAASALPAATARGPGLPAADVRGGLLLPVQQLRSLLLPDAQLHQRASAGVEGTSSRLLLKDQSQNQPVHLSFIYV